MKSGESLVLIRRWRRCTHLPPQKIAMRVVHPETYSISLKRNLLSFEQESLLAALTEKMQT